AIASHQKYRGRPFHSEKVQVRIEQTCEFVARAVHKKAERIFLGLVRHERHRVGRIALQAENEGTRVKVSLRVYEMETRWRREWHVAILRREIIRREKAGEKNQAMERRQQNQHSPVFAPLRHPVTPFESADRSRRAASPQSGSQPPETPTKALRSPPPRRRLSRESIPRATAQAPASSG